MATVKKINSEKENIQSIRKGKMDFPKNIYVVMPYFPKNKALYADIDYKKYSRPGQSVNVGVYTFFENIQVKSEVTTLSQKEIQARINNKSKLERVKVKIDKPKRGRPKKIEEENII